MTVTKISKQQEKVINDYSKEIVTLTSFKEAVRITPGMYIGDSRFAFKNMTREILQNAFDEIIKKVAINKYVYFHYNENTLEVTIQDSGRGLPFGYIINIAAKEHTSSNYNKKPFQYSSGRHGEGLKITNALASKMVIESHILGKGKRVEFDEFIPWKHEEKDIKVSKDDFQQGTRVSFIPCDMIKKKLKIEDMLALINELIYIQPIGTTVVFSGIRSNGDLYEETIVNKDGLLTYLVNMTTTPLIKPILIEKDTGEQAIKALFTFDTINIDQEEIKSFANYTSTLLHGTHVEGFLEGVCRYFRTYMNKIYLASTNNSKKRKTEISIINSDIKAGLKGVVTAAALYPMFIGQAKDQFNNEEMVAFARDEVYKALQAWSKENPKDLQKVCGYLKGIAEIRIKSEQGKTKLSNNYVASVLTGFPAKYKAPISKNHWEFFIVEGDSAKGSVVNKREDNQGVFPIRGKIPNAFSTKTDKFIGNSEISGMIVIISDGDEKNYGRNFNINKVSCEKIILLPDADPDGSHIRSLLLRFFMQYMPGLIEAGKVYAAVPPLFGLKVGPSKYKYFIDRIDYIQYIQKLFSKNNEVRSLETNKILTNKDIIDIIYFNEDFIYDMNKISRSAIDPFLLEQLLIHRNLNRNNLKKVLKQKFRFIDFKEQNNVLIIAGIVNQKSQKIFINDKFLKDTQKVYDKYFAINQPMYYNLNGNTLSLYEFLSAFESAKPKNAFTRYKGLGEMNEDQLGESTLDPENRTLIRYTMQSAKEDIARAKYLDKNKYEFIRNVKVNRIDLIG